METTMATPSMTTADVTTPNATSADVTTPVEEMNPIPPSSNETLTESNRYSFLGYFSLLERFSEMPPPPVYTPTDENLPNNFNSENTSPVPSRPVSSRRLKPRHCKAGNVCVGVGDCTAIEEIRIWKTQYIEVRDKVMSIFQSREKRENPVTVSLKKRYISMPRKRIVAVQGGPNTILLKCGTEIQAHQWLMTLSQYCYLAPTMEGYSEKMSKGKEIFEERFLRLRSDGVLSWYSTESEEEEPRGSIQIRGVICVIDASNPLVIHVHTEPRGYQFRFGTIREAQLWHSAFRWHFGRKLLRRASVPLRNKAK